MKKLFACVIILVLSFTFLQAQGIKLGIKAGTNLTKISGKSFNDGFDLSYHFGGFMELNFNKKWGIQPEVLWSQSSQKPTSFNAIYGGASVTPTFNGQEPLKLDYLSIPILLNYRVGGIFSILAGPQYSILLNKEKNFLQNGQSAFSNGDFAVVMGGQFNFDFLKIYGRYNIGLTNINDIDSKDKWTSQQIQLGIGLRF